MNEQEFEEFIKAKPLVFDDTIKIFTTGAFLSPLKVTDSEGKVFWVWRVTEFIDDSFKDEHVFNPIEIAESRTDLLKADE